jgi:hypothetical protein
MGLEPEDSENGYRSETHTEHLSGRVELVETRRVYRQLVREVHPDKNHEGALAMRCVNQLLDGVRTDIERKKEPP